MENISSEALKTKDLFTGEILESGAMKKGYHGVVVSGFVQSALLGCSSDIITFAGYRDVYNTGGSRLLVKSVS